MTPLPLSLCTPISSSDVLSTYAVRSKRSAPTDLSEPSLKRSRLATKELQGLDSPLEMLATISLDLGRFGAGIGSQSSSTFKNLERCEKQVSKELRPSSISSSKADDVYKLQYLQLQKDQEVDKKKLADKDHQMEAFKATIQKQNAEILSLHKLLQETQIQFQQRLNEQDKGFSMTKRLHEAEVSALRSSEYEAKEDAAKSRSELEYTLQQFARESEVHRAVLKTCEAAKIEITQVKSQFQNAFREQSLLASRTIEDLRSQVRSDASIIESSKTTIRELESQIKTLSEGFKDFPDDLGYQPFEFEL